MSSAQILNGMFDRLPNPDQAGLVTDLNGVVLRANTAFANMTGRSIDALVGQKCADFTHSDDINLSFEFGNNLYGKTASDVFLKRYLHADGTPIPVCLHATSFDVYGVAGLLVAVYDLRNVSARQLPLFSRNREFDNLNAGLWVQDCSGMRNFHDTMRSQGVSDLRGWLHGHPEQVAKLISELRVIESNDACVRMFGADSKAHFLVCYPETLVTDSHDEFINAVAHFYDGNLKYKGSNVHRTFDGRDVPFEVTIQYVPDDLSGPRMYGCMIDITDRVEMQSELTEKNLLLNTALQSSRMGIWEWNIESDEFMFSEQLCETLGFDPGQPVHAQELLQLAHENDRDKFEGWLNLLRWGETSGTQFEQRIHAKHGWLWFSARGEIVDSRQGRPVRAVGTLTEFTEEKQRTQIVELYNRVMTLAAEKESIGVTLNELCAGIQLVDPDLRAAIHLVNEEGTHFEVGATAGLPDQYWQEVNRLEVKPNVAACGRALDLMELAVVTDLRTDPLYDGIRDLLLQLGIRGSWSRPIERNGRTFGTLCVYSPGAGAPGVSRRILLQHIVHVASILLESHWEQVEKQRLYDKMLSSEKLQSLGMLAGGVAHDFRSFLQIIRNSSVTASTLLKRLEHLTPEVNEMLEIINETFYRADRICNQLMAYAGNGKPDFEPVNAAEVVQGMIGLIDRSSDLDVKLAFAAEDGLPMVFGDHTLLSQVILNLTNNAVQALEGAGQISVRVTREAAFPDDMFLQPRSSNEYVAITVTDNGRGFDESTRRRIFDPFFTSREKGKGFGLATVLGNVRQHDGGIHVESKPDVGSRFRIYLPAMDEQSHASTVPVRTSTPCVLVVDDECHVRNSIARLLKTLNYDVAVASDGAEALQLIRKMDKHYDAVMLDQILPGISGIETARQIREEQTTVPIIFMSGFEKEYSDFLHDEHTGALRKPFRLRSLQTELARLMPAGGSADTDS